MFQLASASSALFRDVRDSGTSPPKRLCVLAHPSGERFTAADLGLTVSQMCMLNREMKKAWIIIRMERYPQKHLSHLV